MFPKTQTAHITLSVFMVIKCHFLPLGSCSRNAKLLQGHKLRCYMKTTVPSHAHEPVNAATLLGPTTTMPTEHGEGTRRGPITGQTRNTGQYWAILGDTGHTGRYCRYCGAASRAPGCVCRPPKPREQSPASGAQGG